MRTTTLSNLKKIILISFLLLVTYGYSQTTQTFNASGTFYVPAGVTNGTVQAWGAGGAGGGNTTTTDGAGGGGGGAYSSTTGTFSSTQYTITVGTGGLGVAGGIGEDGGDSSFSTSVIAKGGTGGNPPVSGNGGFGGNGGSAAASTGVTKYNGGNGGRGRNNNTGQGGPGATSAGSASNGLSGATTWSTINAPTPVPTGAGAGAAGGSATNNGSNNVATPGGGGGGAGDKNTAGSSNTIGGNGADGLVIVSWICPAAYALTVAASNNGPFCNTSSSIVTLSSGSMPSGEYNVTYNLSGATTATGNTATMTFTAGSPGTGTFTTPTLNIGSTTVTVTNLSSGAGCSTAIGSFNTTNVNILAPPTATAGTNITGCSSSSSFNITAGSSATNFSSYTWSTPNGTGTFTNANSLTLCTYTPSAADIAAGTRTMTLTVIGNSPCGTVSSSKFLTVSELPIVTAGTNITTCSSVGAVNITGGSSAMNQSSLTWTSSGTGTFTNPDSLSTCTYTPSAADITAGSVTLTLTAYSAFCSNVTATKTLNITTLPTAVAGPTITTCAIASAINITGGSSATKQASVAWTSSGTGTFTNATSLTTCTYNPSAADITAGSVTLTLTAYANVPCSNVTATKTIIFSSPMTAVAGSNLTTCSSAGAINITAGSSATNQTSVAWTSNGTGTFTNANSLTLCTYAPSAADITAGSRTFTLTVSNPGCPNITSTKTLTITTLPTAVAGTTITTCSTAGAVNITAGSSATNQSSVTWTSNGTGTFTNPNSLTTCTYTPSAADITAGSRILTLTAFGNAPCGNVTATKTITINMLPIAVAGTAITTCSSAGAINITTGASATNQTSVAWTSSGTGAFTNATSLTTCTYNPSAADITAGSVTLTLTANGNAPCGNVTATKTLTITTLPTAVAGTTITTCSTAGAINITAGSSATNQSSVTWTSNGTGTFTNPNSLTTCTYTPSAADITAGSRILTLTAFGNAPCGNVTATKTITINTLPIAVAGTAITTCSSAGAINITSGASATNQTSVAWTSSGTGAFTNATSLTNCTYNPSAADITAGSVTLTLTANGNAPCGNVTATKTLTINALPTAVAGTTINTCSTAGAVNITAGSNATNQSSVTWTSNGTGTFTNANSLTLCTYNPSAADIAIGSRTLTLTAYGNAPCGNVISTKTLIISLPTIVTGTTPGSRTGTGTVLLGATASLGTLNWYSAVTGGTLLGSGTSFTTPIISITTTFYVEAVNGGCTSSPRTPVTATVNYPEIDIQGNAASIVSGDLTPSASDWTDFGTTNTSRTFTIRNIGGSLLTVGAITISGTNASEFTVTTAPASAVGISGSTTFVVSFSPTAVGVRTATISIVNNDSDENPYTFAIQGNGVEQEIDVQGNGVTIADGDTTPTTADWTDFNNVAGSRTFTIRNLGSVALTIGAVTISGANASDFTVTTLPAASVAANSTTTFVVTFNPSAINLRTATITIANNDSNENPYDFAIQGFGIIPEIDIQGNGTSIVDGDITPTTTDWTDFSSVAATRTFTIFNNGNITLTIGTLTVSGPNASEFTVTTPPAASIAAFSSTTFTITFIPTVIGTRSARITIVNNDSNENPYDFSIQGTGVAREIDVQGNAISIASGDMVTSVSDGTDFGSADINLATITRTFTIRNTGSFLLTISNPTISGLNASEFSVSANPGTLTIGANSSTTFSVTFNPNGAFTRVAQINIVNNDSDENPYFFAIQGKGFLDNDGDGISNNLDQDDDNDGVIDNIECGNCSGTVFQNGSFETPVIPATSYTIAPSANVPGWTNSAEPFIEIWSTGFNGVPAAEGNQFAELNANVAGTLYQSFCLNGGGGTINWSIKHRGRSGTDRADVRFGATLALAQASSPIVSMIDGTTSWGSYSGTYTIPVGQTNIVLAFVAVSSVGGLSYGNFIDDVEIIINQNCKDTDGDGVADINDVDDDNDGISTIEEAGFKAFSNNKSVMDRSSAATWVDANANGLNDYIETMITNGTYTILDTDGDGVKDYFDLDSDNDSVFDVDEASLLNGDGDINGDGKGDGIDSDGDGLLDLFDNSTVFGTTTRAYAQDSDVNGIPDYLQLDSNDDGLNDIKTGLYGSLDANNDGKIDGSGDVDSDGITDTFDTNTAAIGSPRDINRKLFLDFDGRNDYGQDATALGVLPNASIMAWVDLNNTFTTAGVIAAAGPNFQLRINSSRKLEALVNGTTVTFNTTALTTAQWYHVGAVYNGSTVKLYLNGVMVASGAATGSIASSVLTLGKNPSANNTYFKGKIDELRVFNLALTDSQLQRMIYQEIENNASQVRGAIVPKDIESLPYANILRYYRMDAYKDDIIDNLITPTIDTGSGMKIFNHKVIKVQEAPMPFVTNTTGTFATAINNPSKDIRGLDATDYDYSIIQVKHNITETANAVDLAMFVDPGVTITMNNDTKIQNDWYLKLDGKIDLQGKSQLVQTTNSDLDATSAGSIERDQQGQSNKFNYNYWSSPVGALSATTNNNPFTVNGVLRDGTNPNNIQNITWTTGYDGAATSPITLSSYWIFKFQNLTPQYANWGSVGPNGTLQPAQGYTMKGTNALTANQNYTFVGKPNNGTITTPIAAGNLNLCGNPYASAIDVDAFIASNIASTTGAVYFWEHYSTNTSHNLIEYQGGYAARNLVGGTPPVAPAGISGAGTSSRVPARFIPVGQGFLVYGNATGGNITFDNSQRGFVKETDATSNVLFRQNSSVSVIDRNFNNTEDRVLENNTFTKIRLGFNSVNNYHRQILLGFMNEFATEGFDPGYDAAQLDIQPNDFYFKMSGVNLVIQGVDVFNSNKILPLSVKNATAGNVSFTLDDTENFDENQNIYIHDNVTNEYHDIRNNNFEINLPVGTFETRFSLRFTNAAALGTNDFELSKEVVVSFTNNDNMININNRSDASIKTVELYNILGQAIQTWDVKNSNQTTIKIPVMNISTGAYIVKVITSKGDLSKKIIIE